MIDDYKPEEDDWAERLMEAAATVVDAVIVLAVFGGSIAAAFYSLPTP